MLWCFGSYRDESIGPYWELVVLLARFLTIFIGSGTTATRGFAGFGAVLIILVSLGLLAMQAKFKPFLETPEQATHWSSANKMAQLGYTW